MIEQEKWLAAIKAEIEKTSFFFYQPAVGSARTLILRVITASSDQSNLQVDDPQTAIDRWTLEFSKAENNVALRLYGEGELIGIYYLDSKGVWRGRDRKHKGVALVTPKPEGKNIWSKLANPNKFFEEYKVDVDENSFVYQEALPPQIDWEPFKYDLSSQVLRRNLPLSSVAVAIAAFNRPAYFQQTVQSIASNPEIKENKIPVFLFIDKHPDAPQSDLLEKHTKIIREWIPKAIVICRPRNLGCGRSLIDIRHQLFDNMDYDKVFMFEDDMIVAPNYINLCLQMLAWAQQHYQNVGVVQGWNNCQLTSDEKTTRKNVVRATMENLWGYVMTQEAWNSIKDFAYRYQDLFLGGDYAGRPHHSIHKWLQLKIAKPPVIRCTEESKCFPLDEPYKIARKAYFDSPPTGQDSLTLHLLHQMGWIRICSEVNRAVYIGQHGIHSNPTMFNQMKYHCVSMSNIKEDLVPVFVPATEFEAQQENAIYQPKENEIAPGLPIIS